MEREVMETVLKELLEEQKESNLINGELARYIKSLTEKIERLDKRVMAQAIRKSGISCVDADLTGRCNKAQIGAIRQA